PDGKILAWVDVLSEGNKAREAECCLRLQEVGTGKQLVQRRFVGVGAWPRFSPNSQVLALATAPTRGRIVWTTHLLKSATAEDLPGPLGGPPPGALPLGCAPDGKTRTTGGTAYDGEGTCARGKWPRARTGCTSPGRRKPGPAAAAPPGPPCHPMAESWPGVGPRT